MWLARSQLSSLDITADQFNTEMHHLFDRRWLSTGLTIHKEIVNSVKYKISHLVSNAKSTFYSVKVPASSTVKELYKVTSNLLGKIASTPLPSAYPTDQLPQVFSDFFLSTQFAKSVIPLTARLFIPLRTVSGSVISLVHPCVDLRESPMKLC